MDLENKFMQLANILIRVNVENFVNRNFCHLQNVRELMNAKIIFALTRHAKVQRTSVSKIVAYRLEIALKEAINVFV